MPSLRWICDGTFDGPTNMARDEALLELVGAGLAPPTLRFYRWDPPTISLGYFQEYAEYAALTPPAGQLAVVRRQTGGGAILHDRELTYSLTLPLPHPLVTGSPSGLYRHVHAVFLALLREHGVPVEFGPEGAPSCSHGGPFFCLERHSAFDLLAGGEKLMGSAQRRTPTAILQHGSLILENRFAQQHVSAVAGFARLDIDAYLARLAEDLAAGNPIVPGCYSDEEKARASELTAKYAGSEWTRRR